MKKVLFLCLILITLLAVSCSAGGDKGPGSRSLVVTDSELSNAKKTSYTLDPSLLSYDEALLIEVDNKAYNYNLASLLSLLSADIYDSVSVGLEGDTAVSLKNNTKIYTDLGFSAIEEKTIFDDSEDDVTHYLFASQSHAVNGNSYKVVFVTIQGTSGSAAQWSSNFDVGSDTEAYNTKVAANAYWVNKSNHRGFDIAANMVKERLEAYLVEQGITKEENTILVFTGHSRGAAIANILGAEYEFEEKCKTFTYTFATPAATTDSVAAAKAETVFNIINTDDIVTVLPLDSWGFKHYGKVKSMSANDFASEWVSTTGCLSYASAKASQAVAEGGFLNGFCAEGRDALYVINGETINQYSAAPKDLAALSSYGLDTFAEDVGEEGKRNICPAFVLKALATLISINKQESFAGALGFFGRYQNGFSSKYKAIFEGFVATAKNGGMRDSHATSTYILLTQKLD